MIKSFLILFSLLNANVFAKRVNDNIPEIHKTHHTLVTRGWNQNRKGSSERTTILDNILVKRRTGEIIETENNTVHQGRTRNRDGRLIKRRKTRNRNGTNDVISDVGLFKRRRGHTEPEDNITQTEPEDNMTKTEHTDTKTENKTKNHHGGKHKDKKTKTTVATTTTTPTVTSTVTPTVTSTV